MPSETPESVSVTEPHRGVRGSRFMTTTQTLVLPLLLGGILGFVAVLAARRRASTEPIPGWGGPDATSPKRTAKPDAGLSQM
jgi:hypothetical protein